MICIDFGIQMYHTDYSHRWSCKYLEKPEVYNETLKEAKKVIIIENKCWTITKRAIREIDKYILYSMLFENSESKKRKFPVLRLLPREGSFILHTSKRGF